MTALECVLMIYSVFIQNTLVSTLFMTLSSYGTFWISDMFRFSRLLMEYNENTPRPPFNSNPFEIILLDFGFLFGICIEWVKVRITIHNITMCYNTAYIHSFKVSVALKTFAGIGNILNRMLKFILKSVQHTYIYVNHVTRTGKMN